MGIRISMDRYNPIVSSFRIKRENETPPNDGPTKKRRPARGVQGVHASDMSLVTPENASSRSGWHITPMGRIVHPIRMRPEKPLPPMSTAASSTTGNKKKRKREKGKPVRARRRTIDPTKWDSQHLKGAFLDSIVVADDDDNPPVTMPSQPLTSEARDVSDLSSGEEEEDEPQSSEPESVVGRSSTTSVSSNGLDYVAHTKQDVVDTDHDFNQEKLSALSLLDSMFGGLEGNREWGGKEVLDSDVDIQELPAVHTSSESSPQRQAHNTPGFIPGAGEAQGASGDKGYSTSATAPVPEDIATSAATEKVNAKGKLKDLFAPQEEQGQFPPANHPSHVHLRQQDSLYWINSISTWNSRTKSPFQLLSSPQPYRRSNYQRLPQVHLYGYPFITLESRSTRPSPCSFLSRPRKERRSTGTRKSRT